VEVLNVTFKNFGDGKTPDGYNGKNSIIAGQCEGSLIENVAFKNLRIAGRLILDAAAGHFDINAYTSNITFSP
jgi:hypothetical protein